MPSKKSVVRSNNEFNKWFWLILGIFIGLIIVILVASLAINSKKVGLSPDDDPKLTLCKRQCGSTSTGLPAIVKVCGKKSPEVIEVCSLHPIYNSCTTTSSGEPTCT